MTIKHALLITPIIFATSLGQAGPRSLFESNQPATRPSSVGPQNPNPETNSANPAIPPTKGVISVKSTSTTINPENDERPAPKGFKTPGSVLANSINPENDERPLPEKSYIPGTKLNVTVWGVGPGKQPGIDTPLGRTQTPAEQTVTKGPAISIPPEVRSQKMDEINAPNFLPPGQVDVLKSISLARDWAKSLNFGQVKLHSVELTAGAILGSTLILAYQTLGLGGRQRVLAAAVPPQLILSWTGRAGYRIPSHDEYSANDVLALADAIHNTTGDEDLLELLSEVDPELLDYMSVVTDYVEKAKSIEQQRLYRQFCQNPTLCS